MFDEQVALQSMRLQMHCVQCDMRYSYRKVIVVSWVIFGVKSPSQIQQFILLATKRTHTELTSPWICGHVHRHKRGNEEGQGRLPEEGTKHAECYISKWTHKLVHRTQKTEIKPSLIKKKKKKDCDHKIQTWSEDEKKKFTPHLCSASE